MLSQKSGIAKSFNDARPSFPGRAVVVCRGVSRIGYDTVAEAEPMNTRERALPDEEKDDDVSTKLEPVLDSPFLRERVYRSISEAIMRGDFAPGQKITIRSLAAMTGTSLTPVRDALNRLVAENVLRGEANRSVVIPTLSGTEIRELRDVRIVNECFATKIAASRVTDSDISTLRRIAARVGQARSRGDVGQDLSAIYEFQFALYAISQMPLLLTIIGNLWLKSGPYLKTLFPEYIDQLKISRGDWRARLCDALERRDVDAACAEIEHDVSDAMTYVAKVFDAAYAYRSPRR
jgi:DNA-binding GntR family transcriptional regulator